MASRTRRKRAPFLASLHGFTRSLSQPKMHSSKRVKERACVEEALRRIKGVFEKALTLSFCHFTVMPKTPYIRVWIWAEWFIYFGPVRARYFFFPIKKRKLSMDPAHPTTRPDPSRPKRSWVGLMDDRVGFRAKARICFVSWVGFG